MEHPRDETILLALQRGRELALGTDHLGKSRQRGKGERAALVVLRGAGFEPNRSRFEIHLPPRGATLLGISRAMLAS